MAKKPVFRSNPEARIQKEIIHFLRDRGWFVRNTHGNAYQKGFPDLFCYNPAFERLPYGGLRWVDVKVDGQHKYTKAQCIEWPQWEAAGVGVWIMMEATEEWYKCLFDHPNFREFWKPAYDKYLVPKEDVIDEILE